MKSKNPPVLHSARRSDANPTHCSASCAAGWVGWGLRVSHKSSSVSSLSTGFIWDHRNAFGTWRSASAILPASWQPLYKRGQESFLQVPTKDPSQAISSRSSEDNGQCNIADFFAVFGQSVLDIEAVTPPGILLVWGALLCVFSCSCVRRWLLTLPRKFFIKVKPVGAGQQIQEFMFIHRSSLFSVFSNYPDPVTFTLPPHLEAFVSRRNESVYHLRRNIYWICLYWTPGSCCTVGSLCISSGNLPLLHHAHPFPADSGFSPPLCQFVNNSHLHGLMTSWCCTTRHRREAIAERPVQK